MGMIEDTAEGIKAAGQIAVKPSLAVAFTSGALLYAPVHAIAATGLADFLAEYRMWIGFALLASYACLLAYGLAQVFSVIGSLLDDARMCKVGRKQLTMFTPDEKAALILYIRNQAALVTYSLNGGVVRGSEGKRVLYRAPSVSHGLGFSFNM